MKALFNIRVKIAKINKSFVFWLNILRKKCQVDCIEDCFALSAYLITIKCGYRENQ